MPISVTSFSAESLEQRNVRDLTQIGAITPSVSISQAGQSVLATVVSIRGQRTSDVTLGSTPSIGIYVDDVYRSTTIGLAALGLADATNVEVLKGPQGTLYGRNTTGGAIKVTTALPDYTDTSGRIKVGVGNEGDLAGFAGLSVPLIQDKLALRLTAAGERNNGYARDEANNRDLGNLHTYAFTGTLRAKLADRLEAIVRAGYNKATSGSNVDGLSYIQPFGSLNIAGALQNGYITPSQLGTIFAGTATPQTLGAVSSALADFNRNYVDPHSYSKDYSYPPSAVTTQASTSLTLNYQLGDRTALKSITSYQHFTFNAFGSLSASPIVVIQGNYDGENIKQYTQELTVAGTALENKLSYTAGYFFYHLNGLDVANVTVLPEFGVPTLNNNARVLDTSNSGYFQATYKITPSLNFTGGLRYTNEQTEAQIRTTSNSGAICEVPVSDRIDMTCFGQYKNHFSNWSYTAGLDWTLVRDALVYAKTSRGFKAGGQNIGGNVTGGYNAFQPEIVTDYELGLKTEFFDRAARFNLAAYHSVYKNIQRIVFVQGFDNSVNTATLNAASAKIDGVEAELTVRPISPLTLGASGSWTDPRYTRFIDPTTGADRSKEKFAGVPKWLGSLYATLDEPTDFGAISATVDAAYQSSTDFSPGNHLTPNLAAYTNQAAYTLYNARLTFKLERPNLDIAFYGRNLTNKSYFTSAIDYTGAGLGFAIETLGPRRTFGAEVTKRF